MLQLRRRAISAIFNRNNNYFATKSNRSSLETIFGNSFHRNYSTNGNRFINTAGAFRRLTTWIGVIAGYSLAFSTTALCFVGSRGRAKNQSEKNGPTDDRLCIAVRRNDIDELRRLLDEENVDANSRQRFGWCALHVAAFHGNIEAMQLLLDHGADIDATDNFTNPLEITWNLRLNDFGYVRNVRDTDFSPRLITDGNTFYGTTALHYAALSNEIDAIRLLMDRGADPTLKNGLQHLPIDYLPDDDEMRRNSSSELKTIRKQLKDYTAQYPELKKKRDAEERRRYPLENRLKEAIIGQLGAINSVAAAIRRKESGWADEEHPLVFLFLGSSGIGKTELAKQVAYYLHNKRTKGFIRIDMSEYQHQHEVAKFIGSPPGYVGHEDGGQLTKQLAEFPNAVVLFDEIEKAHPDVLTILLQLFDEGRMTDGKGKTIECKDAVFIMTSNLAADQIAIYGDKLRREANRIDQTKTTTVMTDASASKEIREEVTVSREFKEKVVRPILKAHFRRDEFLGRINEMVYFLPFSNTELHQLVVRELEIVQKRAEKRHRIALTWEPSVVDVLADGYNIHYGARSIKHEVERQVVNMLAHAQDYETISAGCKVALTVENRDEKRTIQMRVEKQSDNQQKLSSLFAKLKS